MTAYELRIGGWSSALCSSSLGPAGGRPDTEIAAHPIAGRVGGTHGFDPGPPFLDGTAQPTAAGSTPASAAMGRTGAIRSESRRMGLGRPPAGRPGRPDPKSVVSGKAVSLRVVPGFCRT